MAAKWSKVKVGDLGRVVTGKTPKTAKAENYGGTIPFLTPSDDMEVKYVYKTGKTITAIGLIEVKNALLPVNSVCVSCIGSDLGKVVITTAPTITNQQINSIIVDTEKFDVSFVYYAMLILGKELNFISKTSTAVPIVNKSSFSNYEINCPDLYTQHRIAEVLSTLDAKIENNDRINDNLEQQTDLLFKDIFSDETDFVELGSVVETTSGGTPSRKKPELYENPSICWVKSKELTGNYIHDTEEKINEAALTKSAAKLLPPHSVLVAMYGATVGEYGIIATPMACNQAICALLPNTSYSYPYLYKLIKYSKERLKNMAVGSAQQNISQILIKQLPIHAQVRKVKRFNDAVAPSFQMIEALTLENIRLALIRDNLLPKLMSGEIDVSDIL